MDLRAVISWGVYPTAGATDLERFAFIVSWGLLAGPFGEAAISAARGLFRLGLALNLK